MNTFNQLRSLLEADYTESSFSGLHPRLAEKASQALATLDRLIGETQAHHITDLGLDGPTPYVSGAFFAAMDKTGAKANELGYMPAVAWLGQRVERYETPSPVVVTLGSEVSPRTALIVVTFTDTNAAGYGDWSTANAQVGGLFESLDDAKAELRAIAQAVQVLNQAMSEMARAEHKPAQAFGPSF
jgi:hypothetical protein